MRKKRAIGIAAGAVTIGAVVAVVATTALATPGANQGASSTQDPFLIRNRPGIVTTSLLTAGDTVDGYRMTGIPDGLGAFDNGDGTFTVLMNHEVPSGAGAVRAHGANGAFVSKWIIDKNTLQVLHGEDLIQRVYGWNGSAWTQIPVGSPELSLSRLCSADLPVRAFYDPATSSTRPRAAWPASPSTTPPTSSPARRASSRRTKRPPASSRCRSSVRACT